MLTVRVQNSRNQVLTLTGQEDRYQLINVDGLQTPGISVNTTPIATVDGSMFASAKIGNRNIVIQVRINGDVESNRLDLYKYFPAKEKITLYFKTKTRNVKIDGYVDRIECPLFTNSEIMQISVICPNPYFSNVSSTLSPIDNGIQIENTSDVPMGLQFEVYAYGGQFHSIVITNETTGEYLELARPENEGYYYEYRSQIHVNTADLQKSVQYAREGYELNNAFSNVVIGSTFLQVPPFATNTFTYKIDDDDASHGKATVYVRYAPFYKDL